MPPVHLGPPRATPRQTIKNQISSVLSTQTPTRAQAIPSVLSGQQQPLAALHLPIQRLPGKAFSIESRQRTPLRLLRGLAYSARQHQSLKPSRRTASSVLQHSPLSRRRVFLATWVSKTSRISRARAGAYLEVSVNQTSKAHNHRVEAFSVAWEAARNRSRKGQLCLEVLHF